jgi:tetratricopeptide (TPR) repeat protein
LIPIALIGASVCLACPRAEDDASRLRHNLVEAVGPEAPIDGRLVGFVYEPSEPDGDDSREDLGQEVRNAVRGLGGGLIGRLRARGGADELHVLGLAGALGGGRLPTESSIATLRRGVQADSGSAAQASDLAAFLIQRGTASDRPDDLVEALETTQRAERLDPALPEARYNLALALDRLVLWHRAREAYQGYLELDPDSGWARRARTRIAELGGLLAADPEAVRRQLHDAARAGDPDGLRELVARAPGPALELGLGEVLPRWATARIDGPSGAAQPEAEAVRALGEAVAGHSGDSMLLDALAATRTPAGPPNRGATVTMCRCSRHPALR